MAKSMSVSAVSKKRGFDAAFKLKVIEFAEEKKTTQIEVLEKRVREYGGR